MITRQRVGLAVCGFDVLRGCILVILAFTLPPGGLFGVAFIGIASFAVGCSSSYVIFYKSEELDKTLFFYGFLTLAAVHAFLAAFSLGIITTNPLNSTQSIVAGIQLFLDVMLCTLTVQYCRKIHEEELKIPQTQIE